MFDRTFSRLETVVSCIDDFMIMTFIDSRIRKATTKTTMTGKTEIQGVARERFNGLVRGEFGRSEIYRSMADDCGRKRRTGFAAFFEERANEHYYRAIDLMRFVRDSDWTMELTHDPSPAPGADWGHSVDAMIQAREMETEVGSDVREGKVGDKGEFKGMGI